jgi:DNA-binding transcriptional ArsR family regulator
MAQNSLEPDRRVYELHAEMCKVLAHPVRLEILDALRNGSRSPTELADKIGVSKANLSQHLAVMRDRRVLRRERRDGAVTYAVTDPRLFDACATLRSLIRDQLRAGGELAEHGFGPAGTRERAGHAKGGRKRR